MYLYYYIMGIILIPGIILSIYAQYKVTHTYNMFKKEYNSHGLTAKEVCVKILSAANINNVTIKEINGTLTDYYDNKNKVLGLSKENYNSTSVSAIGVAAHEVGHALQSSEKYVPYVIRQFVVVFSNIASRILWPLIIIGFIFDFALYYSSFAQIFIYAGVIFFGLSVILNLITLPVEYNASARALNILKSSTILTANETEHARKVLNAAALTYFAALVISVLNLLRFVLVFARRRD